ncbi:hypothetical protein [Methylovorus glucosotrophus]|uniref:hypothetical protein n=1 Tax=Methylovorus glucosotrophus TaxID=266009 RepID=UPI00059DE5A2|nr:hypothetical protein [Methylovorus glucosotrophus]
MAGSNNPHRGSSFDAFLKKEGIYEEVTKRALARVADMQRAIIAQSTQIHHAQENKKSKP